MPNIPSHGAAGGRNAGDKPTAGPQEYGPPSPKHPAAGGYDIPFDTHGASPTEIKLDSPDGPKNSGLSNPALIG